MNSKSIKKLEDIKQRGIQLIRCLTQCKKNEVLLVVSVNSGMNAKNRLANLGIVPGSNIIKKKTAPLKGPVEIEIKGTKLIIGRGLASKIYVKCPEECPSEL